MNIMFDIKDTKETRQWYSYNLWSAYDKVFWVAWSSISMRNSDSPVLLGKDWQLGNSDNQTNLKLSGKEGTVLNLQSKNRKGSSQESTDPIIATQILCYTCLLITWSPNELWKNTRCKLYYIIRVSFSSCYWLWMASTFINKPFNQNT